MISTVDTTQIGETRPPPLAEVGMASEALQIQAISKDHKYMFHAHSLSILYHSLSILYEFVKERLLYATPTSNVEWPGSPLG